MITIEQAYERLSSTISPLGDQQVELADAVGRVLTHAVNSDIDSPPHRKSLMDGYAVRSEDINSGLRRLKVLETIFAGSWPQRVIDSGEASRIMTGAPLPEGADAVAMIEATTVEQDGENLHVVVALERLAAEHHILNRADNYSAGTLLLPAGHRIRPIDVGLMAEAGAARVQVTARPTLAILPTGDELVDCGQRPERGQIRNSNGPMLQALAEQVGINAQQLPVCRDQESELERKISLGLQSDLLVLTGGVSEGLADLVPKTLGQLGVREVFHKVRIKPGKPIWFGVYTKPASEVHTRTSLGSKSETKNCYVFGLPGNPVSSLVGFHLFVRTAIRLLEGVGHQTFGAEESLPTQSVNQGLAATRPRHCSAALTRDHETRGDRPTYWPGRLIHDPSPQRHVEPLAWAGSSDLLSISRADGLIHFPPDRTITAAGSKVEFFPFAEF